MDSQQIILKFSRWAADQWAMTRSHFQWSELVRRPGRSALIALTAFTLVIAGIAAAVGAAPADAAGRRHRPRPVTTSGIAPTSTTSPTTAAPAASPTTTSTLGSTTTSAPGSPTSTTTASPTIKVVAPTSTTVAPTPATTTPPASPTTTVPMPATTTAAGSVLFGVATEGGPTDAAGLAAFESHAGKKVSLYSDYRSFYYDPNFPTTATDAVRSRGEIPMITWEPWDPRSGSASQPAYSLAAIASGAQDALISRWASQVKAWGQPLWLRFAHEMNGDWYPWAEKVNGNRPGDYVTAWRHVHDIFQRAGVANVTWVWSPNVLMPNTPSLASLYPGDAYVDWLGVDGYNWGGSSWQSFDSVFGATLAELHRLSSKPIVIGETASSEVGGSKAQWIQQLFAGMARDSSIKAFVWFNLKKEADWRIESSAAAQQAFSAGVADARYRAS